MSFNSKRIIAACAAILCAASVCGCAADNGYMGTIDGTEIRNGVYLSYMMTAYNNGYTEVTEAKEALGDTSEVTDVFTQTIDGKTANEWIQEDTINLCKHHIAVERMFEEQGLELTSEEVNEISTNVNEAWDMTEIDYYGIGYMISVSNIYGTSSLGEYYESIGVGKDSLKEMQLNSLREEKLFTALYDTDGDYAVSDEEIDTFIADNYASIKYIELPFDDKYGLALSDDADIQAVKDKAQSYVDRLNSGESFIEIQYEFDLETAQNEAAVAAEEAFEETIEAVTEEEYDKAIADAIANATAEKAETEDELDTVISKEYSKFDEELTEYIWNLAADSNATLYETSDSVYVIVRDDITTKDTWKSDNKENILYEIKGEEFDALLETTASAYTVDFSDALLKKYSPDSYKAFSKS